MTEIVTVRTRILNSLRSNLLVHTYFNMFTSSIRGFGVAGYPHEFENEETPLFTVLFHSGYLKISHNCAGSHIPSLLFTPCCATIVHSRLINILVIVFKSPRDERFISASSSSFSSLNPSQTGSRAIQIARMGFSTIAQPTNGFSASYLSHDTSDRLLTRVTCLGSGRGGR